MRELDIGSIGTVVDWKNYCREVCADYYIAHPLQIGGVGKTAKID